MSTHRSPLPAFARFAGRATSVAAGRNFPPGAGRTAASPLRAIFICTLLLLSIPPAARAQGSGSGQGESAGRIEVERIISFLAGDELKGRGSFTPENERAARFIETEFRKSGLVPLEGEDSLGIRFPVYRRTPRQASATLNGVAVPDSDLIVSTERLSVSIGESGRPTVTRMGATFERVLMAAGDGLLLVPRAHAALFKRYRRFYSRQRNFLGEPDSGVFVAVLTDQDSVTGFTLNYEASADTGSLVDVVGVLPGRRSGETVLIAAHYDHLGVIAPVGGDSIANGANDDASGTTAVIRLADYFASRGTPERTLIFAAFAAEEMGGFGSQYLSGRLDPDSIVAMVNLEMVGTVSKFGPHAFWITGYDRSDLGPMVASELKGTGYSAYPDPYPEENLFFRSDNARFARQGVPAHSFSTDPIDVDSVYHTVEDEVERLDLGHLADVIRGIAIGITGVVDGRQTPGRIRQADK